MPNSLLHKAREQVQFFGAIGAYTAERLVALGYDVPALELRLIEQSEQTHNDLRNGGGE